MGRPASGFANSGEPGARIESLLPAGVNTHPFGGGRPRRPDRRSIDTWYSRVHPDVHRDRLWDLRGQRRVLESLARSELRARFGWAADP